MSFDVTRTLAVAPGAAWSALVDLDAWPAWGPSVAAATLDGGGRTLRAGSTGRVRTAVGLSLPFEVTAFEEGRRWAWRVAGVPATGHRVEPLGPGGVGEAAAGCRATIEVPSWAPLYAPLCWVALGRLGRVASGR